MSKPVKSMVIAELKQRYAGTDSACVVDWTGLSVQEQESVRGVLREKSGRLEVIKNSLARKAFADTPLEPIGRSFSGPCALVTADASMVDIAKVLVQARKEYTSLALKDAILDGDPELVTVDRASTMKGRLELIGEIAMLISSPGRALAGCLTAPQSKIAGCLKAMIDKGDDAAETN